MRAEKKQNEWKFIPGYEGFYQASTEGEIRSVDRWVKYPRGGMMKRRGVVLKQNRAPHGYMIVGLSKYGVLTYHSVHRLIATTYLPNTEEKPHIHHRDGNKSNNCVGNLEWISIKDHTQTKKEMGQYRPLKGSECPASKLTEEMVVLIKKRLESGESGRSIAKSLGMGEASISRIKNNVAWKHVS